MTWTSHPASRRVVDSCHTLRSKGTERFSTRISDLRGKSQIPRLGPARLRAGDTDQIDDRLVCWLTGAVRQGLGHGRVLAPDQADLRVVEDLLDRRAEQLTEVRQPRLDELPVRAEQSRHRHVGVVDAQVVALAEQPL